MSIRIATLPVSTSRPSEEGAPSARLTLRRVRDAVAGRDASIPRARAFELLLESDFPGKHRDFQAVLEDECASPRMRFLAATSLGRIPGPAALQILVSNAAIRDERVLAGVLRGLARHGDEASLRAIESAPAGGTAAAQARFAATLITHRLGIPGYDQAYPEERDFLTPPPGVLRPLRIGPASHADAELGLLSLAHQPFGIELAERPSYRSVCGRCVGLLFLNEELTGRDAIERLRTRRSLAGVGALRDETTGLFSPAILVLTSPAESGLEIRVHMPNGLEIFAGRAELEGRAARFAIRALRRPGGFGIDVRGSFEGGKVGFDRALSARTVEGQERPRKVRWPA